MKTCHLAIVRLLWVTTFMSFLPCAMGQDNDDNFMKISSINKSNFKKEHIKKLEMISSNPVKAVYAVKIGNIKKILRQNNGSLPLHIPNYHSALVAKPNDIEFVDDNNYKWFGHFDNQIVGDIEIYCVDGLILCRICVDKKLFEVKSFDRDDMVLLEYDTHSFFDYIDIDEPLPETMDPDPEIAPDTTLPTTYNPYPIRILTLYSEAAEDHDTGVVGTAQLAISQLNQILENSYSSSMVHAYNAGIIKVNYSVFHENVCNPTGDWWSLVTNSYIQQLRNEYQADIVVMFTNAGVGNEGYKFDCNSNQRVFGYTGGFFPDSETAYCLVEVFHATGDCTFAHEIGHLLGANHDNEIVENAGYARGYLFQISGNERRRSVMAVADSCPRVLYFSTPQALFQSSYPVGTTTRYNALKIRINADDVSAYRSFTEIPFDAEISGPVSGNTYTDYTWTVNHSGGISPFEYSWFYTSNGVDYSDTLGI